MALEAKNGCYLLRKVCIAVISLTLQTGRIGSVRGIIIISVFQNNKMKKKATVAALSVRVKVMLAFLEGEQGFCLTKWKYKIY